MSGLDVFNKIMIMLKNSNKKNICSPIGILTITPNIGFGGILQAFALKTVLEDISNREVQVINYKPYYSIKEKVKYFLKNCYCKVVCRQFVKYSYVSEYRYRSQNTQSFVDQYLNLSKEITSDDVLHDYINKNCDTLVVGSDQVWRPKYVLGIENYFAKGIKTSIKKIAYAASLGTNEWEFDECQTEMCGHLLKRFNYVSVRENNAVGIIKKHLGYLGNIDCVLDPTLLVSVDIYKPFIKKAENQGIFTYILDKDPKKQIIVGEVSTYLNLGVNVFNTKAEDSSRPLNERVAPPVEDWLSGIANADFVITDSFHGTVFSIVFNKPFLVYVNRQRGADRFESLLSLLGISERMLYNTEDYSDELVSNAIDWEFVNFQIFQKRNEIIKTLKIYLNI